MRREQTLADRITNSALWRSIVRHGYPDNQRNQALIIASNVFLHIHPVKIKRYATKVTYTFCLGGLSFFMFLVLTLTGVVLMFYYVPASDLAYQNMKDIEASVTFGQLMRNMHRWSAQGMVIAVFLHMGRVFYTGSYKPPREFNWVIGVLLLVVHFPALLHRVFAPVGPTRTVGDHGRHRDRWRGALGRRSNQYAAQLAITRLANAAWFGSTPCMSSSCHWWRPS